MFTRSTQYYDKIYSFKDYATEAERLRPLIDKHARSGGRDLLDMACGTATHLSYLKDDFHVVGADLSDEFLELARRKHPDLTFHKADMSRFDLAREFDVILCLFSSTGYLPSIEALDSAAGCFARHLKTGGVVVIEPWLTPDDWNPGTLAMHTVDEPELKVCRICTSRREDRRSLLRFDYLIGTPNGTESFHELHDMTLFTREEMTLALENAGLDVHYESEGLMGRGLYVCRK